MSHDYGLHCPRCRQTSEEYNHAEQDLIAAVREAYPLWLLRQTGWGGDLWSLEYRGHAWPGIAAFIIQHWNCGGFLVVSEYWQAGNAEREAKYPPIAVRPEVPGGYEASILPAVIKDAEETAKRLLALVAVAKARDTAPASVESEILEGLAEFTDALKRDVVR